ncbi:MAG: ATP phosphoribosyltransferase regulatory subunit [Burkholderiaceae bacterium]|nr:ATP phosphoribosyltransferase regulatory subunit [Burkholderiaceae bacterium]
MPNWLLPESVADVLPCEARAIENLRRRLLDLYRTYGYELVMPPMFEYVESLLTGAGVDLSLLTFKMVDQLSGRTLGLRADMTPQVARIDAHLLDRAGVARLCYAGSVLHARPAGLLASREPLQIGAEIYGHAGIEADLEVIELMVASLEAAGVATVRLDLCHAGIVPALVALDARVNSEEVYVYLQRKDVPGLRGALASADPVVRDALLELVNLYGPLDGPQSVLARARAVLPPLAGVDSALDTLERLAEHGLWRRHPRVERSVDLADLRGHRYHTAITFAAYVDASPNAVARGGRYDDIGSAFGRARPATGFSLELRELAALQPPDPPAVAVRAPWSDDRALAAQVQALRAAGEIVVSVLPGHEHEQQEYACDRELAIVDGQWRLVAIGERVNRD